MDLNNKQLVLNNITIESRVSDSFINATQMCKAGGKKFNDWYRLDTTKNIFDVLHKNINTGHPVLKVIDKKVGGNHSGSWIHPDLAIQLAQWISPEFALQVSRWIRELFISGVVAIDSNKSDEDLNQLQEENARLRRKLEEEKETLTRVYEINKELLSYKKLKTKDEKIYIVSSKFLASQGLYKIGKTKNIKSRNSTHNNTHPAGDKIKVLATFDVNNASIVESTILKKLDGLRPEKNSEFIMCPYDLLYEVIEMMVSDDDNVNRLINSIIDTVFKLKRLRVDSEQWMSGIDPTVFQDTLELKNDDQTLASFDMTDATEEQKQEFVKQCIDAYRQTIHEPRIVWKKFQETLITKLNIPRSRFRANHWKPVVKRLDSNIEWRSSDKE